MPDVELMIICLLCQFWPLRAGTHFLIFACSYFFFETISHYVTLPDLDLSLALNSKRSTCFASQLIAKIKGIYQHTWPFVIMFCNDVRSYNSNTVSSTRLSLVLPGVIHLTFCPFWKINGKVLKSSKIGILNWEGCLSGICGCAWNPFWSSQLGWGVLLASDS